MPQLILMSLVLYAASLVLSVQAVGEGSNAEEANIKDIFEFLEVNKTFLRSNLKLMSKFAKNHPDNLVANSIANLSPETCGLTPFEKVEKAMDLISKYSYMAPNRAKSLRKSLEDYTERCSETEIKMLGRELKMKAPNSNLEAALEIINKFSSIYNNNKLSASISKLKSETCDPAGLKAAQKAQKVITASKYYFETGTHPLLDVLESYEQHSLDVCFKQAAEAWSSNKGAIREELNSEHPLESSPLDHIMWDTITFPLLKDILTLSGSNKLRYSFRWIPVDLAREIRFFFPLAEGTSDQAIRKILHLRIIKPCKPLLELEQKVGILEPIAAMSGLFNFRQLEPVIGVPGGPRSDVAKWAGRWNGCKWFVGADEMRLVKEFRGAVDVTLRHSLV